TRVWGACRVTAPAHVSAAGATAAQAAPVSVLLDTGIVYAYYDRSDDWHARAKDLIRREARGLILPAPVIPEADYLLGRRVGAKSRRRFYQGIIEGHYFVADLPRQGYARASAIDAQFADRHLGF